MADRLLVPKPYLYVEINFKDITAYVVPYLLRFQYIDNDGLQKQESDDVEIVLEDSLGFFQNNPPARGSSLKVKFGYENRIRNAGIFFIDSYTFESSREGDKFTIKALAKDVKKSFRTIKTTAFENMSLKQIAEKIAQDNGYELFWEGEEVKYTRITQNQKRDLKWLSDICRLYAKSCKVSNGKLVIRDLNKKSGIYELTREVINRFEIEVSSLYEKTAEVVYLDPLKKEVTSDTKEAGVKASGDVKKLNIRVESKEQAEKIAEKQALLNSMKEFRGRVECVGIPDIYAGCWISLKGFGKFDRTYYVQTATHIIERERGYYTELELLLAPKEG